MRLGITLLAAALVLSGAVDCGAQTSPPLPDIVPDRPDFTESSDVVGHRVVHIETGVRLEERDTSNRQLSTPNVMVRVGLGSRLELRVAGEGYISQSAQTSGGLVRTSGRSDIELSAKFKMLAGDALGLHAAVLPVISFPTASEGLGSDGLDLGLKFAWARALPQAFDLSGNVNVMSTVGDARRSWAPEVSVSVGRGIGGHWGVYGEAYAVVDRGRCACAIDAGVSLALGPHSQIDVEAGRGIGRDSRNWFVGAGLAIRGPQE